MEKVVLSSYGGGNVSESQKAGTIRSLARWLNRPPHLTDEQMQMWTCAGSGCTTPGPPPTPLWDVGVYQPSRSLVCFQCRLGGGSGACFWKYSCHQGYKRCSQKCTSKKKKKMYVNPVWMYRIDAQSGMNKMMKIYLLNNRLKYKSASWVMTHSSMNDQQEQPSPQQSPSLSP